MQPEGRERPSERPVKLKSQTMTSTFGTLEIQEPWQSSTGLHPAVFTENPGIKDYRHLHSPFYDRLKRSKR